MEVADGYRKEGRIVFVLPNYGSMHYCGIPAGIVDDLLKTKWNILFPSHPEIAREFLC